MDIKQRRKTYFVLWRPFPAAAPPRLRIGKFVSGNPPVLSNEKIFDLSPSTGFGDLWEIPAASCHLQDGEIYHYWFEIRDSDLTVCDDCLVDMVGGAKGCVSKTTDETVAKVADVLTTRMEKPGVEAFRSGGDYHRRAEQWATDSLHVAVKRVSPSKLTNGCVIQDHKLPHQPLHVLSRIVSPSTKKHTWRATRLMLKRNWLKPLFGWRTCSITLPGNIRSDSFGEKTLTILLKPRKGNSL